VGIIVLINAKDKIAEKIQDTLKKELEARTVLYEQKGEIELQNIEITDV